MKHGIRRAIAVGTLCVAGVAAGAEAAEPVKAAKGAASAADVARGRYLSVIGGCNDCHTLGYAPSGGQVAEAQWLLGDGVVGFSGPWGTTYAPNLRRGAASMSETEWLAFVRALKARPPMPWFTLNQWKDSDLRALYRYVRQLGPPGDAVTAFAPPGQAPKGPVIRWPAPPK
ncbi:MAG: cytochrome C [Betaproteobacteria bacterium]